MGDFLLEIYSEEIPARMQLSAVNKLKDIFIKEAEFNKLSYDSVDSYVTPQRLVLCVKNLPEKIIGKEVTLKGPSISAPEQAIEGFCKSNGVDKNALHKEELKGKEYFFLKKISSDTHTSKLLEDIIKTIFKKLQWQKTMRWNSSNEKWVRPIRSIIAIFDRDVIDVDFANVKASNKTIGHRFMSPKTLEINSIDEYLKKLQEHKVILNQEKRKEAILKKLREISDKNKIVLKQDEGLLNEVNGLVEYPYVMVSKISEKFMSLPSEILITSMAVNQKYFSFTDLKGEFSPYFVIVSNIEPQDDDLVIEGNKKVLEARLYDAKFFYENDIKTTLESKVEGLKKVTFHSKLGSVYDKVQRFKKIAEYICGELKIDAKKISRAAILSKADLVSETVFEFTELQGVIGKYFALHDVEDEVVAEAIEQHYLPQGKEDELPQSIESCILAVADKVDTIVSMFSIDEKPTSSKDPFALRRDAIGVVRIINEKKINIDLEKVVDFASKLFGQDNTLTSDVVDYIFDRLVQISKDDGFDLDVLKAASIDKNISLIMNRVRVISNFLNTAEGQKIYPSIKRINNILGDKRDNKILVDTSLFETSEEKDLYSAIKNVEIDVSTYLTQGKFEELLKKFGSLSEKISQFFENVMVNDKNEVLKKNRFAILSKVISLVSGLADFTQIR